MTINPRNKDAYKYYVCSYCLHSPDECMCSSPDDKYDILPYHLIVVDINIQKHLQILYEKGYVTEFSCESHDANDRVMIGFAIDYGFDDDLPMPEGFNKVLIPNNSNGTNIRCSIEATYGKTKRERDKLTKELFEEKKQTYLNNLLAWCESLPPAKEIDWEMYV